MGSNNKEYRKKLSEACTFGENGLPFNPLLKTHGSPHAWSNGRCRCETCIAWALETGRIKSREALYKRPGPPTWKFYKDGSFQRVKRNRAK